MEFRHSASFQILHNQLSRFVLMSSAQCFCKYIINELAFFVIHNSHYDHRSNKWIIWTATNFGIHKIINIINELILFSPTFHYWFLWWHIYDRQQTDSFSREKTVSKDNFSPNWFINDSHKIFVNSTCNTANAIIT